VTQRFDVKPFEDAYTRRSQFALELLDAVTLERVSRGIELVAEGLGRKPIVNHGGLFVWVGEELSSLRRLSIQPGHLPYEAFEGPVEAFEVPPTPHPIIPVLLRPLPSYAFPAGITGLRSRLIEQSVAGSDAAEPVGKAEVWLQWLDDDGVTWRDAVTRTRTLGNGDFVCFLRLTAAQEPQLDAEGRLNVRLFVRRPGLSDRHSPELVLSNGRIDSSPSAPRTFAWDDLQF
jgi:hypothetical protein